MFPNNLKLLAVFVCAALVSFFQSPTAHGFAGYDLPSYNFVNLGTNPNQFASWDSDVIGGSTTTVTYRFDSSFTSDNRIRNQVRLAFDQWDSAWLTADGMNYSYMRNSGTQPFGDIRSIMVHEIGHALVYHHPDVGDSINRNYGLNASPPPPLVTQADQNNEVMRSWIPAGAYNQILSHDELDGYEHFYGSQNLNFTELTSGTPDILISAGPESSSSTWAATTPAGVQRDATDVTQGWRLTSAPINFNSTSSTPMGFRTLGINWDYQNPSSTKLTREFEIRTRGTSNPTSIFHYDGSAARHFNTYSTTSIGSPNEKNDLLHHWSDPDPGDFSPSDIIHVGVELDAWDWTVVSAEVVHPDATKSSAPLLSFHDWNQTVTGVASSPDSSGEHGINMGPPVRVIAHGLRLVNTEAMPTLVRRIGLGIVDGMGLRLQDLNGETLKVLERDARFKWLDLAPTMMDKGGVMTLIFDGDPVQPTPNPVFVPDGESFLRHELFGYVETTDHQGGAVVGNYALLGTMPITMTHEPAVPGDIDGNGMVNSIDLGILLGNWGQDVTLIEGELNGIAPVDSLDLGLLLGSWTGTLPLGAVSVPEPSTLLLSLLTLSALCITRRRA
ncbi:MAG: PEP-CTERM sorting domain-containing protein [Pirellulales bacterium]